MIATVLIIGVALLIIAIRSRSTLALLIASVWNAGIVFSFMSPHNFHVFHLRTHRMSVIVNAAIGIAWLIACVISVRMRFRRETT